MSQLGTLSLVLALALAGYSLSASVAGARQRNGPLLVSAQRAAYATVPALAVGVFALVTAFLQNDFSIRYVAEHSNLAMPRIYTWVAFYAGNAGSLLFVCFALAAMWALALSLSPALPGDVAPLCECSSDADTRLLHRRDTLVGQPICRTGGNAG